MSFYIKRCNKSNKGGAFICKSNQRCGAYSVAAFIRIATLNRSFAVTAHLLGKKGKNERFILLLGKLTLISQVRSCQTSTIKQCFRQGKNWKFLLYFPLAQWLSDICFFGLYGRTAEVIIAFLLNIYRKIIVVHLFLEHCPVN